ncbi:MAG: hypothetical protein H6833_07450 [Planctomycetes bacterium]|nr:hypothetical protein [Planctomycetota bacterium]
MRTSTFALAALLALPNLLAQEPPPQQAIEHALLFGDRARALELLAAPTFHATAPERALLEAAVQPIERRARAMIDAGRAYRDHVVADTALVAGLTALILESGDAAIVSDVKDSAYAPSWLARLPDEDGEEGVDPEDLPAQLRALRDLYRWRCAHDGDPEALQDARRLLGSLSLSHPRMDANRRPEYDDGFHELPGGETMCVSPGTELPVPEALREAIRVRFVPWDLESDPREFLLDDEDRLAEDTPGQVLPAGSAMRVHAPREPGVYLLQLTSVAEGWHRMRRLIVSDLRLTAQVRPGRAIVLATSNDEPVANVNLELHRHRDGSWSKLPSSITDEAGIATISLPLAEEACNDTYVLFARHEKHAARLEWRVSAWQVERERSNNGSTRGTTAHLMVDRPLYRAGETVQGRILLRRHAPSGEGIATTPLASRALVVRLAVPAQDPLVVAARTDEHGVAAFTCRLPEGVRSGEVDVSCFEEDSGDPIARWWSALEIASFHRPPVFVQLEGPEGHVPFGKAVAFTVHATYAAGGNAAGLRVEVVAKVDDFEERVVTFLDGQGHARIQLSLDELPDSVAPTSIHLTAVVTSSDGQRIDMYRKLWLQAKPSSVPSVSPRSDRVAILCDDEGVAGIPLHVQLHGPPRTSMLLSVQANVWREMHSVRLDERGNATIDVPTRAEDWPSLRLRAISTRGPASDPFASSGVAEHEVRLHRPGGPLRISLDEDGRHLEPGEAATWTVRTRRADGRPAAATLAIAIVDESLFQLREDGTEEPARVLRPKRFFHRFAPQRSRTPASLDHVIGWLLEDGRIPPPTMQRFAGYGATFVSPSTPGRGTAPGRELRQDFRATALFLPALRTDASGIARFTFTLPDDLTAWRVTIVAVDDDVRAAMERFHVRTTRPLSVTPILPRFLRTGDRLEVPVTVAREDAHTNVDVVARVDSDALRIEAGTRGHIENDAPTTASHHVSLHATRSGDTLFEARVESERHADAVRLSLPILDDAVARTRSSSLVIEEHGTLDLATPDGTSLRERKLVLLGSRDALLQDAATYLGEYPYGCAEQTLSRLVPVFTTARARKLRGDAPVLPLEHARRIEVGMERLRALHAAPARGIAWWPGGQDDLGITALVLIQLAQARDAGIDAEAYGLTFDLENGVYARSTALVLELVAEDERFLEHAELTIAAAFFAPHSRRPLEALHALVASPRPLPPGLLTRAGWTLARAGHTTRARDVLARLFANDRIDRSPSSFPGESVAARAAHRLELVLALEPDHPERLVAIGELLAASRDGRFGSTYATAAAVQAFAHDAELLDHSTGDDPVVVQVRCGTVSERVELDPTNRYRVEIPLPIAGEVQLDVAAHVPLFACLRGQQGAAGSTSTGWTEPLHVERSLHHVRWREDGTRFRIPIEDSIATGELLDLVVRVTCERALTYVVVDCPIPAGFEVVGRPRRWDLQDDRVVTAIHELEPGEAYELSIPLCAGYPGDVSWPPVVAHAMYTPELSGASHGTRLHVVPPTSIAGAPTLKLLCNTPFVSLDQAAKEFPAFLQHVLTLDVPIAEAWQELAGRAHDLVDHPSSREHRSAFVRGEDDRVGAVYFVVGSREENDGAPYQRALVRLLTPRANERSIEDVLRFGVLARLSSLLGDPWREDCEAARLTGVNPRRLWESVFRGVLDVLARDAFPWDEDLAEDLHLLFLDPYSPADGPVPAFGLSLNDWLDALRGEILDLVMQRDVGLTSWFELANDVRDRNRTRRFYELAIERALPDDDASSVLWKLMWEIPADVRSDVDPNLLSRALSYPDLAVQRLAFELMPPPRRTRVPSSCLRAWIEEDGLDADLVDVLVQQGEVGYRTLVWAMQGLLDEDVADRILERLPTARLADLPLIALRSLAALEPRRLANVLAVSRCDVNEFADELVRSRLEPWRLALDEALALRLDDLPRFAQEDPHGQDHRLLIGAWRGEPVALETLRTWLSADDEGMRSEEGASFEPRCNDAMRQAALRALRPNMTSRDLLTWGDELHVDELHACYLDRTVSSWRDLLQVAEGCQREVHTWYLDSAKIDALLPELLHYLSRVDTYDDELWSVILARHEDHVSIPTHLPPSSAQALLAVRERHRRLERTWNDVVARRRTLRRLGALIPR